MPQNSDHQFRIIYSVRRKHPALRIGENDILEILSPAGIPAETLLAVVKQNGALIARLRQKFLARGIKTPEFNEGELFPLCGKYYPLHLTHRLRLFDGCKLMIPRGTKDEMRHSLTILFKEAAQKYLTSRCMSLADKTGLVPAKVRIGNAVGRWGSCTAKKVITFSWRLMHCPAEVIDYVICHELAHLKELNHSEKFWTEVYAICPEYQKLRKRLRLFAKNLINL